MFSSAGMCGPWDSAGSLLSTFADFCVQQMSYSANQAPLLSFACSTDQTLGFFDVRSSRSGFVSGGGVVDKYRAVERKAQRSPSTYLAACEQLLTGTTKHGFHRRYNGSR